MKGSNIRRWGAALAVVIIAGAAYWFWHDHPQYADQAKGDNHLSQHGQNVLTADQAAVKQRNPR
ncbi:hypothetical protein BV506_18470, partial [Klebsiella pneumoniae]